jgi:hypothetical protein
MKIFVKAKPNAKTASVEKIDETHYFVAVKEPPVQGKANVAVMEALAEYFKKGISHFRIVSGFSAKQKVVEIL